MSDTLEVILWLAAALAGMGFSALFSGAETGIYSLNRIRLRLRSDSGQPRARLLLRLTRNQRSLLGTLLIGNNIANYLGSSAVVALCSYTQLADWQIALVVPAVIAPLLLVFGEIVPKNIFQAYSDRYTYSVAPLLNVVRRLLQFTGLLLLVDALSSALMWLTGRRDDGEEDNLFHPRQQVRWLIRESSHQGILTPYQSYMADRVMNLRNVHVWQVMVPLGRVQAAPVGLSRAQFLRRVQAHEFSRIPIYQDRPANIIGVVNTNTVISSADGDRPLAEFVYDTVRLRPDAPVVHALFTLQRAHRAIGIVTDKAGAAVGVVTIKDLVEEIVGEIEEW